MSKEHPLVAVVDDEESVRKALQRLLRSVGMTTEAFATGAEFLQSLADHKPDCIVLDIHMPGMTGFEVQARLAVAGPPLPVVIITGYDSPETQNRVMTAGASAYLRKPINDEALLAAIHRAIGGTPA
ncbi:MAG: Response regulator protein TmoT [Verrucomicrobiae bacterium]|nr:Response regulator protein TmoT [Verrucomicrobiae bacterium]